MNITAKNQGLIQLVAGALIPLFRYYTMSYQHITPQELGSVQIRLWALPPPPHPLETFFP